MRLWLLHINYNDVRNERWLLANYVREFAEVVRDYQDELRSNILIEKDEIPFLRDCRRETNALIREPRIGIAKCKDADKPIDFEDELSREIARLARIDERLAKIEAKLADLQVALADLKADKRAFTGDYLNRLVCGQ